jgi:GntR family transcriptional regulator
MFGSNMAITFRLNYDSGVPVYRQIYDTVVAALVTRQMEPEEQLPTLHGLAAELDINPNTVIRAYQELERGGYVRTERGRGTFPVFKKIPEDRSTQAFRKILADAVKACHREKLSTADFIRFLKKEFP